MSHWLSADPFERLICVVTGLQFAASIVVSLCALWYLTTRLRDSPISRRVPFALLAAGMAALAISLWQGIVPVSQGPWTLVVAANLLWFWQQRGTNPATSTRPPEMPESKVQ